MINYDPAIAPESDHWLALDEQLRIVLAEKYHTVAKIELPDARLHAAFHVIVENQLAESVDTTVRGVTRLMREGVSRHDAIHAIGSVLGGQISEAAKSKDGKYGDVAQARFDAMVAELNAEDWK